MNKNNIIQNRSITNYKQIIGIIIIFPQNSFL